MIALELAFLPIFVQGAYKTYVRGHAGYRADQQMILAAADRVEHKAAFAGLPHQQFIASLERVNLRGQFAMRNQFEEEFDFSLIGRGRDGIRAFRAFVLALHAEGGVLAGSELELGSGIDANHPELRREIDALGNPGPIVLVLGSGHGDVP